MVNTTGLTVGLAVAIPTLAVALISFVSWRVYRKRLRKETDLEDLCDQLSLQLMDHHDAIQLSDETSTDINKSSGNATTDTLQLRKYVDYYDTVIPMLPNGSDLSLHSQQMVQQHHHSPQLPQHHHQPQQPLFIRRISKSIKKPATLDPASDSHSSLQSEYIKQLNRNDSSSFPLTTHTLANASNHAINSYNNYTSPFEERADSSSEAD